jgi:hypothetical protein
VLILVLGERPLRTGFWFYLGALGATLGIGVLAAFVLGERRRVLDPVEPQDVGGVLDIVFALAILVFVVRWLRSRRTRRRPRPRSRRSARWSRHAPSRSSRRRRAGTNPGMFIPIALKTISSSTERHGRVRCRLALLQPGLAAAARPRADRTPDRPGVGRARAQGVRAELERNARIVAAVIVIALAASLLRNGIAGLTG